MGAGQIGGIATLLDMDFNNAATFIGEPAVVTEAQYVPGADPHERPNLWLEIGCLCVPITNIKYGFPLPEETGAVFVHGMVHYLSHAMMFCMGVLIEAHVVLTPAVCVIGEKYKFPVFAGTHKFSESSGASRNVHHLCVHKGFNSSMRWTDCLTDNLALLILDQQYDFNIRDQNTDYLINRVRYGVTAKNDESLYSDTTCRYFGWGSRRNGFLIPLLLNLRRVSVVMLPRNKCLGMFNYQEKYLCVQQGACRSPKFGALCPDDIGSVIVCSGFAHGMMTSRLVDRPCGTGFLDLSKYSKFLTCGVDDSRDVLDHDVDTHMEYQFTTRVTPLLQTLPYDVSTSDENYTTATHGA